MREPSADDQLPEYVKQCLEHESYSKVHGVREVHYRLDQSLTGASLALERARFELLLSGNIPIAEEAALEKVIDKGPLVDNRNWELMPDIGGLRRPIRELTLLGDEETEAGVKAKAAILLAVTRFARGEEVVLPSIAEETVSELESGRWSDS